MLPSLREMYLVEEFARSFQHPPHPRCPFFSSRPFCSTRRRSLSLHADTAQSSTGLEVELKKPSGGFAVPSAIFPLWFSPSVLRSQVPIFQPFPPQPSCTHSRTFARARSASRPFIFFKIVRLPPTTLLPYVPTLLRQVQKCYYQP